MPRVKLEWFEQWTVCTIAFLRRRETECDGSFRPAYSGNDSIYGDIDAVGAEQAVAKFLNRYWLAGVNTHQLADVAPDIEVRQTPHANGRLCIRPDKLQPERPYVLVRGTMPDYEIVGWIRGKDARRDEWIDDPNKRGKSAYYVPASALCTCFSKKALAENGTH